MTVTSMTYIIMIVLTCQNTSILYNSFPHCDKCSGLIALMALNATFQNGNPISASVSLNSNHDCHPMRHIRRGLSDIHYIDFTYLPKILLVYILVSHVVVKAVV